MILRFIINGSGSASMSSPFVSGRYYRLAPPGFIVFDSSTNVITTDHQRPAL